MPLLFSGPVLAFELKSWSNRYPVFLVGSILVANSNDFDDLYLFVSSFDFICCSYGCAKLDSWKLGSIVTAFPVLLFTLT